jgi:hypothetical protein
MEKYQAIEIKQVVNGFIITRAYNPYMDKGVMREDETVVFNDFDLMVVWLAKHFGEMSDE